MPVRGDPVMCSVDRQFGLRRCGRLARRRFARGVASIALVKVGDRPLLQLSASRRLQQILVRVNVVPQVAQVQVAVAFAILLVSFRGSYSHSGCRSLLSVTLSVFPRYTSSDITSTAKTSRSP